MSTTTSTTTNTITTIFIVTIILNALGKEMCFDSSHKKRNFYCWNPISRQLVFCALWLSYKVQWSGVVCTAVRSRTALHKTRSLLRWWWSFSMPYCELCEMGGCKRKIWSRLEIIIVIVIIRHGLGLNRPVVDSSNNLFQGLPSRLRPFSM